MSKLDRIAQIKRKKSIMAREANPNTVQNQLDKYKIDKSGGMRCHRHVRKHHKSQFSKMEICAATRRSTPRAYVSNSEALNTVYGIH